MLASQHHTRHHQESWQRWSSHYNRMLAFLPHCAGALAESARRTRPVPPSWGMQFCYCQGPASRPARPDTNFVRVASSRRESATIRILSPTHSHSVKYASTLTTTHDSSSDLKYI